MAESRTQWGSRFGFILAASGGAVGLGNIWKFPYITGTKGGGWFVLIYLACILLVGLPILAAEINTLADGLVLDRYFVQDQDHDGEPPEERVEDICQRIHKYLTDPKDKAPTFTSTWTSRNQRMAEEAIPIPTEIKIDNETAENYTIVEVFTQDRQGLLYQISRMLYDMGLSVHVARITTHLDQVVDVFYVTDEQNEKICDIERLERIKQQLGESLIESK